MTVFEAMLDDWTNEGFDPFAAPDETGAPCGVKHGNNTRAVRRQRVVAKRIRFYENWIMIYADAMPRAANWIILAIILIVALSPLGEMFDKTDEWSQDGSDFVLYIICLFCFLAFSVRRGTLIIARLASARTSVLPPVARPQLERTHSRASLEERGLFLTFCDLRI